MRRGLVSAGCATVLAFAAVFPRILATALALASVGCATALAFAAVLAPILTTALALAFVLSLTRVFRKGLFFVVRHGLERDPRTVGRACRIGPRSEGSA